MFFRSLLIATVSSMPTLAAAQTAAGTEPAARNAPSAAADEAGDEDEIVVTGQKLPGSVIGDIPPENVLDSRDIRATGATSIGELLDSVAAQTGSARGRGNGPPVILLDGQRISGFRELREIPPEAIQRMEILPEEVALKYGYAADQRVVNIVLRRRFSAITAEARGTLATDGGYAAGSLEATRLAIRSGNRTSLGAQVSGNNPLYESERRIALDPGAPLDPRDARTLVGARQDARATGSLARKLDDRTGLTLTAEAERSHARSRFGRPAFDPTGLLTRDGITTSLGVGSALNSQQGDWRLSATGNADYERNETNSDRSLASALTDDRSRSTRTSVALDTTANGPLFALPAGRANVTLKAGLSRLDLDSRSRRRDLDSASNLGRTVLDLSGNLDLPLAKRGSAVGRLAANLNAGLAQLSDFGTLTSVGGGVHWSPTPQVNLLTSWTREEGAPTLQQLGDPLVESPNTPFFDARSGRSVLVTALTGGNRDLSSDRRTVWKVGANWQVSETPELRLRGEFVRERIDRPQIGFPAATAALEAAFPGRFIRDGNGDLQRVDLTPVNAERSSRDSLRFGFDFSKQLRSIAPNRSQLDALRQQFARYRPAGERPPAPPAGEGERRGFGGGGSGRGGGFFGGRSGGRLNFSVTDTLTLRDRLEIAPGLPALDYLHGDAAGAFGGRPRHLVEAQGGYYNNGLGARLSANWRSATRLEGDGASAIRFGDYATMDLRLFANLGERFDLVAKHPFFLGSSVRFEVNNLLNERPDARDSAGRVPLAYQADRLEPVGRTIVVAFRKLFIPRSFFQFRGRSGSGFGPPRDGPPSDGRPPADR